MPHNNKKLVPLWIDMAFTDMKHRVRGLLGDHHELQGAPFYRHIRLSKYLDNFRLYSRIRNVIASIYAIVDFYWRTRKPWPAASIT